MVSRIVLFWRECTGPIHPADLCLAEELHAVFNLDYPPPAFIGDIENAPVVLLNGNGGYNATTPAEFPDRLAVERALRSLHHPGPADAVGTSPYYLARNYAQWLLSGEMALVPTENSILPEITCEVPNRVIIRPHAGDGRTVVVLAGGAGEIATPAPSREPRSPPSAEHSASEGTAAHKAI